MKIKQAICHSENPEGFIRNPDNASIDWIPDNRYMVSGMTA
jgi:hypothetical protein